MRYFSKENLNLKGTRQKNRHYKVLSATPLKKAWCIMNMLYKDSLCFFLSVSSLWDSHHVPWFSWSFPRDPLGSVLCSVFCFCFFLSVLQTKQSQLSYIQVTDYFLSLFKCVNSLVKFSFQLLYFLTPEFPYGSFL